MAKVPTTAPPGGDRDATGDGRGQPPRDEVIRGGVLAALGQPPGLYQMAVLPLWKGYFRVNVLTGPDASSVRVAHSYFVRATDRGDIVSADPPIVRAYH